MSLIPLTQLPTPACLIDEERLRANAAMMVKRCEAENLTFRPHVKTLKCIEAAAIYAPLPSPITVSTLAEAKAFANAGYQDILYAVALTANKWPDVVDLIQSGVKLSVVLDNTQALEMLAKLADELESPLNVFIELDVDDHRAGLSPEDDHLVLLARRITQSSGLRFAGVMAHAGASYSCFSKSAKAQMARQECERASQAASILRAAGITCPAVSVGSTPTVTADIQHQGVTELRAGVYATFDLVMAGLNVCHIDDIALSVVTTVIGQQIDKGWVLIDAGWMALSRDQGTANHEVDCGYGLVADIHGRVLDGWYVSQTNQEHGIIRHREGILPPKTLFQFGTLLRILPIHACATAGQFQHYLVTRDNQSVSARWQRINGW